jgi:leucyl aminopeptidase
MRLDVSIAAVHHSEGSEQATVTSISVSSAAPRSARVEAIVVGVVEGRRGPLLVPGAEDLDEVYGGKLAATLAAVGAVGKKGEVTKVPAPTGIAATVVAAVGMGDAPSGRDTTYDHEALRRAAGAAARALAGSRRVAMALPAGTAEAAGAVAEGALLGAYSFLRYRHASRADHKPAVEAITVVSPVAREKATKAAVARAEVVVAAVSLARDLVNTPPSDLHPAELAHIAVDAATDAGVDVEVLDEEKLAKGGYGGILGVGKGSVNPPRLVRLAYTHPKARKHLALVGKGITFDSGGLSLKPPQAMEWMKSDMGGAAAVIATVTAVARISAEVNVTGWVPMAENMPSGTAQRPSDVLTIYGGKTVEVLNTDAEGRLILADAIARASEDQPDAIIDIATLTGAQLVALGTHTAALMSNDDDLRAAISAAASEAGEQFWPMPLPEELRKSIDSEVADIQNMGERYGGMLVAGLFLKEFVGAGLRWAHLDIAGPAWNASEAYGYTPKGGTGMGVRTLVQVAENLAAEPAEPAERSAPD